MEGGRRKATASFVDSLLRWGFERKKGKKKGGKALKMEKRGGEGGRGEMSAPYLSLLCKTALRRHPRPGGKREREKSPRKEGKGKGGRKYCFRTTLPNLLLSLYQIAILGAGKKGRKKKREKGEKRPLKKKGGKKGERNGRPCLCITISKFSIG